MSEMPERLKPCPFCGEEAILEQTGKNQITIKCRSCQVKRVQRVFRFSLEWLEKEMIKHWNTRHENPTREHADELRKGIEELQEAFKRREAQPTKGQKRTMSFCVDCSIQHLFDLLAGIREEEGK